MANVVLERLVGSCLPRQKERKGNLVVEGRGERRGRGAVERERGKMLEWGMEWRGVARAAKKSKVGDGVARAARRSKVGDEVARGTIRERRAGDRSKK